MLIQWRQGFKHWLLDDLEKDLEVGIVDSS